MTKNAKRVLEEAHALLNESGKRSMSVSHSNAQERAEAHLDLDGLEELKERGLIEFEARSMGFTQFKLTPAGIDYFDAPAPQSVAPSIHIDTIHGSAIVGNQANATINIGATMAEVARLVSALPAEQQPIGEELIGELKKFENGEAPIHKGAFAKFSDLLAKHGSLASAVVGLIAKLAIGS